MAPRKKTKQKSKVKNYCVHLTIVLVSVLFVYFWLFYGRFTNKLQKNKSSIWQWFNLIPTKEETSRYDTTLLLEILHEDLNTAYFIIIQTVCLLIPRETTSIIAAIVLIVVTFITFVFVRHRKDIKNVAEKSDRDQSTEHTHVYSRPGFKVTFSRLILLFMVLAFLISIPWEYVRLFQIEVAQKMAVMEKGVPKECYPDKMTITQSIRYWLLLQLSWQHDHCEKYHKALLVDPLWEITPLMVVSSVITRSILHPIELFFSGIGKSFKLFFHEIPAQWQPVMLVTMTIIFILTIIMVCGYRISLPFLLKIEPKTPVLGRIKSYIIRDSGMDNEHIKMTERKQLDYHG